MGTGRGGVDDVESSLTAAVMVASLTLNRSAHAAMSFGGMLTQLSTRILSLDFSESERVESGHSTAWAWGFGFGFGSGSGALVLGSSSSTFISSSSSESKASTIAALALLLARICQTKRNVHGNSDAQVLEGSLIFGGALVLVEAFFETKPAGGGCFVCPLRSRLFANQIRSCLIVYFSQPGTAWTRT